MRRFTLIRLLTFFTEKGKQNVNRVARKRCGKTNGRFLYSTSKGNLPMMSTFSALLEARDPSLGRFRAYLLEAGTDLFGAWLVDVTYGRIGTRGRRIRYVVRDETEARNLVRENLRRRATAKRRIGVAYQFTGMFDPEKWCSAESGSFAE